MIIAKICIFSLFKCSYCIPFLILFSLTDLEGVVISNRNSKVPPGHIQERNKVYQSNPNINETTIHPLNEKLV